MASEISSLLRLGWANLWKNRVLWLFSSLVLIEPVFDLIVSIQEIADAAVLLLNLIARLAFLCFSFLSTAGVSLIAYHIAIGDPINLDYAIQGSKRLFWRVVAFTFLLCVFLAPCAFVLAFSFWRFLQIKNIPHNFFLTAIPLSIFAAMWYFPITETIAANSPINKSLKAAWAVFSSNWASLAIIGLLWTGVYNAINVLIGIIMMLIQNSFDVSTLSKLDFMSPYLSFQGNVFYALMTAIPQTAWQTYSTSIFTIAYLKYNSAKMSKHIPSDIKKTA